MSWVEDCEKHSHLPVPDPAVYYPERFISNYIFAGEGPEVHSAVNKLVGTRFCHT